MKNVFTLGIIALIAVITFAMIGCGDGNGGGDAPDLPGTITISPTTATVGTKLTATYSGTEDVSYQWKHGASNVGSDSNEFTPNAVGSYTVTVSAAGFKSKTSAAVNVTESGIVGDGNVSISGSAVVGQTLTAMTNLLGGSGDITYQWKNSSGDTVIGTESTYFIQESDIGFTITVTVTRSGLSGPVTSQSTGMVIEQPEFGISLNPSTDHTFLTALAGTPMEPYSVTITNIGKQATQALSLSVVGDTASFTLSRSIISNIAPGGSESFTVVPASSITTAKKHEGIVQVTGGNFISSNFVVDFTSTLVTVTFDSNGGNAVPSYTNQVYGTIAKPTDPTKIDGRIFISWFKEASLTNKWDFDTDIITESITLYAKWSHLVTFDSMGGSAINPIGVLDGQSVAAPSNPTLTNGTFEGWYMGEEGTNAWNFTTTVTGDLTLCADWKITVNTVAEMQTALAALTANPSPERRHYNIALNVQGLIGANIATIGNAINAENEKRVYLDLSGSNLEALHSFGQENLIGIVIPPSAFVIYAHTFGGSGITSITIPATVTEITYGAFYGSSHLNSVTFEGNINASNMQDFETSRVFPGDLLQKYYATDPENGTPGTYTTATRIYGDHNTVVWTLQP